MSLIFWKLIFFFPKKFSNKLIRVPPLYQLEFKQRVHKVIFSRYSSESKLVGLFINYTIKNEFNILKINIFFSLQILKKVDEGPPFVSISLQTEGSKSNIFRDIRAKVNSLDSLIYILLIMSLIFTKLIFFFLFKFSKK